MYIHIHVYTYIGFGFLHPLQPYVPHDLSLYESKISKNDQIPTKNGGNDTKNDKIYTKYDGNKTEYNKNTQMNSGICQNNPGDDNRDISICKKNKNEFMNKLTKKEENFFMKSFRNLFPSVLTNAASTSAITSASASTSASPSASTTASTSTSDNNSYKEPSQKNKEHSEKQKETSLISSVSLPYPPLKDNKINSNENVRKYGRNFNFDIDINESPFWPERAFHIHTQHPLELTDVLQVIIYIYI
jgi:hypothetical protein